jgi:hypothetical protein
MGWPLNICVIESANIKKPTTAILTTITTSIDDISFGFLVDFRAKIVFLHDIAQL